MGFAAEVARTRGTQSPCGEQLPALPASTDVCLRLARCELVGGDLELVAVRVAQIDGMRDLVVLMLKLDARSFR